MVERWNIGFQKYLSYYNFIVNPVCVGTINPTLHYLLRAVGFTLQPGRGAGGHRSHYSLRSEGATIEAGGHYSIVPSFQS